MKAFHKLLSSQHILLSCMVFFLVITATVVQAKQNAVQLLPLRKARMNIVFLDDSAVGLPNGAIVRYNHWPEWDARVPTFQKLLCTFIADFHKARGQHPGAKASLYALEISADANPAQRDREIAKYLTAIDKATKRPTLVLARSTSGTDQLRLVFVFEKDCPPQEAAEFLAALAEISPPIFHGRIGERFGPFCAPPTIVFDPRVGALASVPDGEKARHRWALLEEEAYLLPHYVLHMVASLHEAPLTELAERTVEPGAAIDQLTNKLEQVQKLRAKGGFWNNVKADHIGNQAVKLAWEISRGGIHNLDALSLEHRTMLRPEVVRVTDWNEGGGNASAHAIKNLGHIGGTVGGGLVGLGIGTGAGPGLGNVAGGLVGGATGGVLGGVPGEALLDSTSKYRDFGQRFKDHFGVAAKIASPDRISGTTVGSMDNSPDFNKLSLSSLTPKELSKEFSIARNITFHGGSDASPANLKPGGILFEHDNDYIVDISGRLAWETTAEAGTKRGFFMGRTNRFDDMPLLWLDIAADQVGALPVAVPRFLTIGTDIWQCFGGPWSFEPLTLDVHYADGRLLRATVTPAETCTRVSYMPLNSAIKDAPPMLTIRNGTGFEPALNVKEGKSKDKGFIWTLRHGVTIEFSADGLVEAIRSPHGEYIQYIRESDRLVGQEASDGRRIDISYCDNCPTEIVIQGKSPASYEYCSTDQKLVKADGNRNTWMIGYADHSKRPSRISSAAVRLSLAHDKKARLTSVECGVMSVGIEYLKGTNTLRIADSGKPEMEWLLGPISGPVMKDHVILLTRSISGRILQVSRGTVQGEGDARKFTTRETISLVR